MTLPPNESHFAAKERIGAYPGKTLVTYLDDDQQKATEVIDALEEKMGLKGKGDLLEVFSQSDRSDLTKSYPVSSDKLKTMLERSDYPVSDRGNSMVVSLKL